MKIVEIKSGESKPVKLSPAPILPAASFTFSNQTGIDLKVTVDGKRVRLEKGEGS